MTALYSLRSTSTSDYAILKLDEDLNPDGGYILSASLCTCPAGAKQTCRHRKMLPIFLAEGHVDDGWLLEWETRLWRRPPAEATDETITPMGQEASPPPSPAPEAQVEPRVPVASGAPLRRRKITPN